jgi:membrane fusion protein (multidrug efflux system)
MQQIWGRKLIATLGILVFCLMVNGCGKPGGSGGPPQGGTPEVAVVVMQPQRVQITTELPGRTSAYLVAEVRPQVNGIIQKRLFTEGGDVKTGEILYQIDPAPYQAAYNNAMAALAKAEASLPTIRARFERYRELVIIKAVSQQEYDDVSAALKQAEADVEYWKAAVESARINLGYTRVTAAISGRIGKSNITVGALVSASQPSPLAVIQQLDPVYVDATQSSANLLQLQKHMAAGRIKGDGPNQTRVKLLLEDGTPYPLEGKLKFSDITVEPSTGSFILRIVFQNPKNVLLPGMYVRAVVQEGVMDGAILVPQQGVSRDPKGNPVALIVDAEGKVAQRQITVDRAIDDKWLVSSGLGPGDRVIVEGIQKVRPGVSAKVVPFDTGGKDGPQAAKAGQLSKSVK